MSPPQWLLLRKLTEDWANVERSSFFSSVFLHFFLYSIFHVSLAPLSVDSRSFPMKTSLNQAAVEETFHEARIFQLQRLVIINVLGLSFLQVNFSFATA